MKIPFQDLNRLHASIADDIDVAMTRVVSTSSFVGGEEVSAFEGDFATAHERRGAAACGSGTDALALTLRALGVGPGDEVVVPSMTFVATAEAVVHAGATPVVADVDPETLLLTPDSVAAVTTTATRAVIPVHLYGQPVSFQALEHWRAMGLGVVEDAAQAHLASWNGRGVGEVGNAACFSFYPGKNLGAFGDGGAVVSDDADLLERVRLLRDHGRKSKYVHEEIGWCSRLDGLQAAVLAAKLKHLPVWTDARRQLAKEYRQLLEPTPVRLVPFEAGAVHHLMVVRVPAQSRTAIQAALNRAGVSTGVHYPLPLSRQPAISNKSLVATPHAELAADEVLSLPMDPLMTTEQVAYVCQQLEAAVTAASP